MSIEPILSVNSQCHDDIMAIVCRVKSMKLCDLFVRCCISEIAHILRVCMHQPA